MTSSWTIVSLPKLLEASQDDVNHIVGSGHRNSEHFGVGGLEMPSEMWTAEQKQQ